jgi:hypothetical protein
MQAYEICKKPAAMHDSASGLRITENGAVKGLRNRSFLKRSAALPPRANPTNKLAGLDMRVTCLPPKPNELANQPCITVARKWWWAWVGQPGEEQDNMIDRSSRADFQPMTTIISPCDSTICFIFRKFGQDVSTWMSTPCIRGSAKDLDNVVWPPCLLCSNGNAVLVSIVKLRCGVLQARCQNYVGVASNESTVNLVKRAPCVFICLRLASCGSMCN